MENFGLILAVPITLVTSTIYCLGAAFLLSEICAFRPAALVGSMFVCFCILSEVVLCKTVGAKTAYSRYSVGFYELHMLCFWFGPPAIANMLLLLFSVWKNSWKYLKITISIVICWFACMGFLFENIAIHEEIDEVVIVSFLVHQDRIPPIL
jgi:hypothetical protein